MLMLCLAPSHKQETSVSYVSALISPEVCLCPAASSNEYMQEASSRLAAGNLDAQLPAAAVTKQAAKHGHRIDEPAKVIHASSARRHAPSIDACLLDAVDLSVVQPSSRSV